MATQVSVVAVIPNFNMAEYLARLLPQVLGAGYDRVFVLDDASTDDSVDVVAGFGDDVVLIRSPVNQGAGTNRNQIIGHVDDETLIHFVDADMDLKTPDSAAVVRDVFARCADRGVGVVGGLVRRADGAQELYNYGPVFSLRTHLTGGFPPLIDRLRHWPALARPIAKAFRPAMRAWPKILETPVAVPTYWVHEGNMIITAGAFGSLGGYDSRIREHETQDLAIRLQNRGVRTHFDPSIEVMHHHAQVRGRFRMHEQFAAAMYLIRTHGLRRYLVDH
ncbi:glycosyl transferase [Mycobacterium antarcticum]|uniref:glycosyltransferase family 2 protein n=1 Tax=Mycolicibacterium sp. TUM20983 TaxID=3023369 RepID=UPI002388060B|nr:glycosyltransferase [Mycolicibacterium sp. TUM20983]GLP75770.1 glycosyl transferase [Mycolicibacterium sp. TUM20983]